MNSRSLRRAVAVFAASCWLTAASTFAIDPQVVGTWETSGINQFGPWRMTWEMRADGTYFLSGAITDHGRLEADKGVWKMVSEVNQAPTTGTYALRKADWMATTSPLGPAEWKRTQAAPAPEAAPIAVNPTPPAAPAVPTALEPAPPVAPAPQAQVPPRPDTPEEARQKAQAQVAYERGDQLARKNDFAGAMAAFTQAIELNPQHVDAWNDRGWARYHRGEFDQALEDYNQALKLNLSFAFAYGNRALVWLEKEDYDKMRPDFERCYQINPKLRGIFDRDERTICEAHIARHTALLRRNPRDANALFNRARAYEQLKDYPRALEDANRALPVAQKKDSVQIVRGNVLLELNKYDDAIEAYTDALRANPAQHIAYHNRAVALHKKKEYRAAIQDFTEALRLKPADPEAYAGRARAYKRLQEYEKAIADYTLADRNGYSEPWESANQRGYCYAAVGKTELAFAEQTRAIEFNPQYSYAHFARAEALQKLGRTDEVKKEYIAITQLPVDEKDASTFSQRASAFRLLEDYPRSLEDFGHSIAIDPANSVGYAGRAATWFKLKKYPEAIADYSKALSLDSSDNTLLAARADIYSRAGQFDLALADCEALVRRDPKVINSWGTLTWNQLLAQRPQAAIESAQKALEMNPKVLWLNGYLTDAYLMAGQFDRARELCLKYRQEKVAYCESVLDDLNKLKERGVTHPDAEKLVQLLQGAAATAPALAQEKQ
jgi:tetratricopeptide (TPR) repeat protein